MTTLGMVSKENFDTKKLPYWMDSSALENLCLEEWCDVSGHRVRYFNKKRCFASGSGQEVRYSLLNQLNCSIF
jgi:hypothetical protein